VPGGLTLESGLIADSTIRAGGAPAVNRQVEISAPSTISVGVGGTPGSPDSTVSAVGTVAGTNNHPAAENPTAVFDGDLDGFIEAGIRWRKQQQLIGDTQ
jgi:hypothetical protein